MFFKHVKMFFFLLPNSFDMNYYCYHAETFVSVFLFSFFFFFFFFFFFANELFRVVLFYACYVLFPTKFKVVKEEQVLHKWWHCRESLHNDLSTSLSLFLNVTQVCSTMTTVTVRHHDQTLQCR